jgi:glyoxylase-like metal-dependent hydrolase (beta-lactamase superfamily II)
MLFTLEALPARHGDALLLHYGDPRRPRLIVIDGGPRGVYKKSLKPRLEALRESRTPDGALPIQLLMVSHIDDDHIQGVLELTGEMIERQDDEQPQLWKIRKLWHNSFDDILGNHSDDLFHAAEARVGAAGFGEEVPPDLPVSREAALVLANVPQGRELRQNAGKLAIRANQPFENLVLATGEPVDFGDGLSFRVLGPAPSQVQALQEDWDKQLKKKGLAEPAQAAAYLDQSVYNLSSIVVLAEAGGRTMLLTGDARGDHVLEYLEAAGLFDQDGRIHVDLLKLPHHGSHHNVGDDFFERITADHYVASGDGGYDNPELETFEMISRVRGEGDFTVHVTYPLAEFRSGYKHLKTLKAFLTKEAEKGKSYKVRFRSAGEKSVVIDLGDEAYEGQ